MRLHTVIRTADGSRRQGPTFSNENLLTEACRWGDENLGPHDTACLRDDAGTKLYELFPASGGTAILRLSHE